MSFQEKTGELRRKLSTTLQGPLNFQEKTGELRRKISTTLQAPLEPVRRLEQTETYGAYDYEANKFTGVTTFHGLIRIYNAKPWAKAFWLVVVILALSGFTVQAVALFRKLSQKPVVSTVDFKVARNGMEFPAITVCNYSPINASYVEHMYNDTGEMSDDVLSYILMGYLQVENLYSDYADAKPSLQEMHAEYEEYVATKPDFDLRQFYNDSAYEFYWIVFTCEETLLVCKFGGQEFDCCEFAEPVMTDIGKCYIFHRFSSDVEHSVQMISGSFYGLELILDIHQYRYPEVYVTNFFDAGVRLFVHHNGVMPVMNAGGISAGPEMHIYAGISVNHYDLLPVQEWGSCQQSWAVEEDLEVLYTAQACESKCVAEIYVKKCQCVPLRYNFFPGYPVCEPYKMYDCVRNELQGKSLSEWYKEKCHCLTECDRWDYTVETSYVKFPSIPGGKYLYSQYNLSLSQIKADIVVANLFLKEMSYVNMQQNQAVGPTETLSDIGGNLGLFLGASVVTLFEITVFCVKLAWASFSKRRRGVVVRKNTIAPIRSSVSVESLPNIMAEGGNKGYFYTQSSSPTRKPGLYSMDAGNVEDSY